MVTLNQTMTGISNYIDHEILPKMSGLNKWIISAAATAYISKAKDIVTDMRNNKVIASLGLIGLDNSIDIESVYKYLKPAAEKCAAPVTFPVIGTITFDSGDVDKLYEYIMGG